MFDSKNHAVIESVLSAALTEATSCILNSNPRGCRIGSFAALAADAGNVELATSGDLKAGPSATSESLFRSRPIP